VEDPRFSCRYCNGRGLDLLNRSLLIGRRTPRNDDYALSLGRVVPVKSRATIICKEVFKVISVDILRWRPGFSAHCEVVNGSRCNYNGGAIFFRPFHYLEIVTIDRLFSSSQITVERSLSLIALSAVVYSTACGIVG